MKHILSGAAVAIALAASPASAMSFAGNLSGSYANFSNGGGDAFNLDGAAATSFGGVPYFEQEL